MVSVNDDSTNKVFREVDTLVSKRIRFYVPGSIGMSKTYNFTTHSFDVSAHFKVHLGGEKMKFSTDTLVVTGEVMSDDKAYQLIVDHFVSDIPEVAVRSCYEYWHTHHIGSKKLWEFMQMTEPSFDAMMLRGKVPPQWNPVFNGGLNIVSSTEVTAGEIRIEHGDGTFTTIKLGD